ncbi:hypothetical protein [Dictyobacter formicarum]|uniref:Uncharacterized protein n=1 Tax=Dictyobacter formicarum TaxID=2778368 RepID=A0ABQ3VCD3_9CHLR|nr:hypothetical protein [Dictyobacter formicarum]GHO83141.1 hypothetical protein KSZ_11470 [Dictyobacter formicarum]
MRFGKKQTKPEQDTDQEQKGKPEQNTDQEQKGKSEQNTDQEQKEKSEQTDKQEQKPKQGKRTDAEQKPDQEEEQEGKPEATDKSLNQVLEILKQAKLINMDASLKSLIKQGKIVPPKEWGLLLASGHWLLLWRRKGL